ncbi:hypothetical protein [Phaffia rhodozyma]|uniref:Uncharacterized protein n=1 Tax=Phaffia rhodozyma TaxID=264483 RepID=A0A0F7SLV5_PHARH|nr:hypothetical protein [Phaffia rhodozyma]
MSPSVPLSSASSVFSKAAKSTSIVSHPHPIRAFSSAKKECAVSSTAYGQCILARYKDVERGMCEAEFQAFKACIQKSIGRKW